ncbi:hypothetical protein CN934_29820 [Ensifer sp. MMN_5]|nr:hypothetical protein CN934_29820 [Ensifer sp. MMN_5]
MSLLRGASETEANRLRGNRWLHPLRAAASTTSDSTVTTIRRDSYRLREKRRSSVLQKAAAALKPTKWPDCLRSATVSGRQVC